MRRTSRLVVGVVIVTVAGMTYLLARAGQPLPPQANVKGKSLAEWTVIQNEWAIADGLGSDTDLPDTVKRMRLLPGAFGGGDFEIDVVIPKGTGIVSSPWFAFGELYEDKSPFSITGPVAAPTGWRDWASGAEGCSPGGGGQEDRATSQLDRRARQWSSNSPSCPVLCYEHSLRSRWRVDRS